MVLIAIAAIFYLFKNWRERFYYFAFAALTLILARGLFTEVIRLIYYRPRPFLILDFTPLISAVDKGSFPSGHAAFYFALAIAFFGINKKIGWWFLVGASLVGMGRILVGVHWPLDIIAGALVAVISAFLVAKALYSVRLNLTRH